MNKKGSTHITWNDMLTVKQMLKVKGTRAKIVQAIGICERTLYYELARGNVFSKPAIMSLSSARVCFKTKGLCVKYRPDKMEHMKRHEISEKQWNRIKDLLSPEKKPQGGRPGRSNREMLNAILCWLNAGIPWRNLPERFWP